MAIKPDEHREARPVLLSKTDALDFAAKQLERMANDFRLGKMLLDVISEELSADGEARQCIDALRNEMREPEMQIAAMEGAAKAIRELSIEERILSARGTYAKHIPA